MEGSGGGGLAPAEAPEEAGESPQGRLPPGPEGAAGPAEPESAGDAAGGETEGGRGPRRALRAVYVRSESSQGAAAGGGPEAGALKCLLRACEAEGAHLTSVPFGELDFGETAVLDAFYDAGEGKGPPWVPTAFSQALPPLHSLPWPSPPVLLPSSTFAAWNQSLYLLDRVEQVRSPWTDRERP